MSCRCRCPHTVQLGGGIWVGQAQAMLIIIGSRIRINTHSPPSKNGNVPATDRERSGTSSRFVLPTRTSNNQSHEVLAPLERARRCGRRRQSLKKKKKTHKPPSSRVYPSHWAKLVKVPLSHITTGPVLAELRTSHPRVGRAAASPKPASKRPPLCVKNRHGYCR